MKINVLDTEYDYKVTSDDIDAYTIHEARNKIILVSDKACKQDIQRIIFHAFLFESSYLDRYDDEILVDWLSIQFPKILEVLKQADAL